MRPIIHTIKHYVNFPVQVAASGARITITIVDAIAKGAARAAASDVEEGATIKAVYLEFWIASATALLSGTWTFTKLPSNVNTPTFTEMANLGSYTNKKNIFVSGQGIVPSNGNVMNIFKGWVKVPKGKQRMGLGDRLVLNLAAVGADVSICGITTYKEYE